MFGYLIFALLMVSGLLSIRGLKINNKNLAMVIFAFIAMTLFCGSIDAKDFGTDVSAYFQHAEKALNLTLGEYLDRNPFEIGFAFSLWVVVNFFSSAQAFMFFAHALISFSICYFIYKNSKDVFVSIVFYLFVGGFTLYFTAIRQGIAFAICLFAVEAVKNKKRLLGVLFVVLGSLFHKTSIVYLPVILLYNFKVSNKNTFIVFVIAIFISLFLDRIIDISNKLFEMEYSEFSGGLLGPIVNLVIYVISLVLLHMGRGNIHNYDELIHNYNGRYVQKLSTFNIVFYMGLVAVIIYSFMFFATALQRVAYYFIPVLSVLIAEGVAGLKLQKERNLFYVIYIIFGILLFVYRVRLWTPYNIVYI